MRGVACRALCVLALDFWHLLVTTATVQVWFCGWTMRLVTLQTGAIVRCPLLRLVTLETHGNAALEVVLLMTRGAQLVLFNGRSGS